MTLSVYENNRLTRTEQIPFTRTGITPFDRVEWFLQAGETDNNNQNDERSAVAQAGVRLPVTPTLALTSGAAIKKTNVFWKMHSTGVVVSMRVRSMAYSRPGLATFTAAKDNAAIFSKSAITTVFH